MEISTQIIYVLQFTYKAVSDAKFPNTPAGKEIKPVSRRSLIIHHDKMSGERRQVKKRRVVMFSNSVIVVWLPRDSTVRGMYITVIVVLVGTSA